MNSLGVLTYEQRVHHRRIEYYSQHLDLVAQGYPFCIRAITVTAFLAKVNEETVYSSLTFFVPLAAEVLLKSNQTQHFSGCCFTSFEVLLLSVLHITLLHCRNLNPVILLPYITNVFLHNYLTLMVHFLTPHNV